MEPSAALPSGARLPLNGFGTWKAPPERVTAAVRDALHAGYRHIDCAAVYLNESAVGRALSAFLSADDNPVSRSDLFVTSKVWNTCHTRENVVNACKQTLADLQLDYLDLYLVHHPFSWQFGGLPITEDNWVVRDEKGAIQWGSGVSLEQTWRGLEDCVEQGLVKSIGVSNYSVMLLMDLLQYARIPPAVNQCEAHVYNTRSQLREVCAQFGVHFTMYSVLGSGKDGPLADPTVARIAKEHSATPAQVLLAWGMAHGCSVLAKSERTQRIQDNFAASNVTLSGPQVKELDALDRGLRVCDMVEYWDFPSHA